MFQSIAILIICVIAMVVLLVMMPGRTKNFNMSLITDRPTYGQTPRERFDPSLTVLETLPYPRSGQPFQQTQSVIQDARQPTDEQFAKTMGLFDIAGTPMWTFPAAVKVAGATRGLTPKRATSAGGDERGKSDVQTMRDFRPSQTKGFNNGAAIATSSSVVLEASGAGRPASKKGVGWWDQGGGRYDLAKRGSENAMHDAGVASYTSVPGTPSDGLGGGGFSQTKTTKTNEAGEIRHMADMDLERDNLYAIQHEPPLPSYFGGTATRDPRNGDVVWTPHAGPESGPWGAKWVQANPTQPVLPLDDERMRERRGPTQLPTGGLLEPYSDANKYSTPWKTNFSMVDGKPWSASKQMVGPDGKLWTGLAYEPAEAVPHLDFLPANHPQRRLAQHWQAAAIKNRLPPTEMRKNLEKTIIGDVKRYRELPWSFGDA